MWSLWGEFSTPWTRWCDKRWGIIPFSLHLYRYLVFDVSVFFPGRDRSSNLGAVQSNGKLDGKKGQQWRLLRLTHSNWRQLPFISRNTFDREDKTEIVKKNLVGLVDVHHPLLALETEFHNFASDSTDFPILKPNTKFHWKWTLFWLQRNQSIKLH